jgi:hypothetical protein
MFTWFGFEPELEYLFAYLFAVSFMHVTCLLQIKKLRKVELSGDFVTATHETCMTHCLDRLHYLVSMLTLILLPL